LTTPADQRQERLDHGDLSKDIHVERAPQGVHGNRFVRLETQLLRWMRRTVIPQPNAFPTLYRLDPACVVSKDIGETEKNLAQVFDASGAAGRRHGVRL